MRPPKLPKSDKPRHIKAGGQGEEDDIHTETILGTEHTADVEQHAVEAALIWGAEQQVDTPEEKEAKEASAEEKADEAALKDGKGGEKAEKVNPAAKFGPKISGAKAKSDGFEKQNLPLKTVKTGTGTPTKLTGTHAALGALALGAPQADTRPLGRDSLAFLGLESKEHGVLFKEAIENDGHTESAENPELAAAVEECIRLLFGVGGILRVGAGENDAGDPVVVVVAAPGFGEAALKTVPPKVHAFATVLALPYDLLPLKRER